MLWTGDTWAINSQKVGNDRKNNVQEDSVANTARKLTSLWSISRTPLEQLNNIIVQVENPGLVNIILFSYLYATWQVGPQLHP